MKKFKLIALTAMLVLTACTDSDSGVEKSTPDLIQLREKVIQVRLKLESKVKTNEELLFLFDTNGENFLASLTESLESCEGKTTEQCIMLRKSVLELQQTVAEKVARQSVIIKSIKNYLSE